MHSNCIPYFSWSITCVDNHTISYQMLVTSLHNKNGNSFLEKPEKEWYIRFGPIENGKYDLQWSSHSNDTAQSKCQTIDQILEASITERKIWYKIWDLHLHSDDRACSRWLTYLNVWNVVYKIYWNRHLNDDV